MSEDERLAALVAAVKDDPRVLGVAKTPGGTTGVLRLLLVSTWDGGVSLVRELPRLGAVLVPGESRIEQVQDMGVVPWARIVAQWTGIGVDGVRVELTLRRVGDLVPERSGQRATVVHDPRGLVQYWIDASTNGPVRERETPVQQIAPLRVDSDLRIELASQGNKFYRHDYLNAGRSMLSLDDPVQAAIVARIDDHLRAQPGSAEGNRLVAGADPTGMYESFLLVADGEGFKGDRMLFGEAVKRLRDLSSREPVFDQGFVVPTFDAVEAAFALGEAVGGCQPPLVPGVYVGVGVTPKDHLEFWAAPFVRDPTCSVACVDDTGERDVVERKAGRDPMVAALTDAVDAAWERLPELIDRARESSKESVDPAAALAPLHLPKSFVERAKRHGADALMCSRLTVALGVARAGNDCAPLVARKFGLAAGRVIARR